LLSEKEESLTSVLLFAIFLYFAGEAMASQQDRHCPKCKKSIMVFKGERKAIVGGRMFELLLVCISCSHEEWQKFSDPLKIWMD